jgi:hypothetical protein
MWQKIVWLFSKFHRHRWKVWSTTIYHVENVPYLRVYHFECNCGAIRDVKQPLRGGM